MIKFRNKNENEFILNRYLVAFNSGILTIS